ncbi:MAG: NAD(P)H-hydrate dehydratase [Clostridia bacterium]|nr:NAD(P)H-hydrate dehydratase [Clostridia bacterium]
MIKTGIDVVEIQRFAKMAHLDSFAKRVFSKEEQAYFASKKSPYESIAGHYAAKEAFSKYLGTGVRGFNLNDITVLHQENGKPYLLFHGNPVAVDLSITHSDAVAVAVVAGEELNTYRAYEGDLEPYRALLPKRNPDMNKGDCGRVLIVAGSKGMTGAATLSALGALRSGCGLLTVATPDSEQPILAMKLTEAMTMALPSVHGKLAPEAGKAIEKAVQSSDVCVFGPGLGKAPELWKSVEMLFEQKKPLVLDADGLNALSGHIDSIKDATENVVMTPHPGEMARLTGLTVEEIQQNRELVAKTYAKAWGVTVLLKGRNTVIASPDGQLHINPTGNSGMASGGMGDVLSGVIGALMGQGLDGYQSAVLGAFLHGLAGDLAAKELGEFGMIAGDVAERLPRAFLTIQA